MAINGSLSGISFSGLSSGIDTDGIISRLMQLEQIPISRLQSRQQAIQQQQSVFGQFRSKLLQKFVQAALPPLTENMGGLATKQEKQIGRLGYARVAPDV